MLRCINRLVEPTSGSIILNGMELVALRGGALRRARRKIGMVFQGFNLIDRLTVMENVLAGRLGYWSASASLSTPTSGPTSCPAASASGSAWCGR